MLVYTKEMGNSKKRKWTQIRLFMYIFGCSLVSSMYWPAQLAVATLSDPQAEKIGEGILFLSLSLFFFGNCKAWRPTEKEEEKGNL